ncbi:MAG: extracellular solute-binding protein [Chloroflexota bacterium]|nr:extracellular solute-binding protein [Chloroflexota bacterium]
MSNESKYQSFLTARVNRRRMLGIAAGGAVTGILAACGSSNATDTPKAGASTTSGGAAPTSQGVVTITTPTPAAASAATKAPGGSAVASGATPAASGSITVTRPELKGAISMARQPNVPLSSGKPDPNTVIFGDLLKRYQQEHPGITIDYTDIPSGTATDLYQWVTTHTASKSLATIVATYADQITTDVQEATNTIQWVPLTPELEKPSNYSGQPWKNDFNPDLLTFAKFGLKNSYGVPFTRYKSAWVYNKDAWKKAGLTDADAPKTWKQWFAVNDKLKAAGLIPIARAGDVQAASHTAWILMISLGRKQWDSITGGKETMSLQQKLDAVCGQKWTMDTPWSRAGWPALKQLFTYYPPGYTSLKTGDARQLFYEGKATMIYESQAFLQLIDESQKEGLAKFEIGAFPTPQPDAETFGADVASNAGKLADDGERGITYSIPNADLRDKGKDAMGQAIAIDYMQWMTQPKIQAEYVRPSYDLPVNPNVKLEDPRFAIWQQNPEQIFYRHLFYFNNISHADRPQWGQNLQTYLTGQENLDDYLKKGEQQLVEQAQISAREAKIDIKCS